MIAVCSPLRLLSGLFLTFVCLGYVLLAVGVHTRVHEAGASRDFAHKRRRELKSQQTLNDEFAFVDAVKLRPKIDPLAKLKSDNREETLQRMNEVEANLQDLYTKQLEQRGQLVAEDGGHRVLSYPNALISIPSGLKYRSFEDWLPREKIWANLTHFPWPDDERCKDVNVSFASPHALPMVALASFPSSGNTWLRYLLEATTGLFTGSMYNDFYLKKEAFYGEGVPHDSGMTRGVKTHGFTVGPCLEKSRNEKVDCNDIDEMGGKAILLIRNPFKALIGHRNLDVAGHRGFADESHFQGAGWDHFVDVKTRAWEDFYLDWLQHGTDVEVLHFEHLTHGRLKQDLRRAAEFLDESPVDEERLQCVVRHSQGRFLRQKKSKEVTKDEERFPFSESQRQRIMAAIDRVNRALLANQKEQLPVGLYQYL